MERERERVREKEIEMWLSMLQHNLCLLIINYFVQPNRANTLVEKKGLLWLLDEEAIFPGSSDESFVERLLIAYAQRKINGT